MAEQCGTAPGRASRGPRAYRLILLIPGTAVLLFGLLADFIRLEGGKMRAQNDRVILLVAGFMLLIAGFCFHKLASVSARRRISLVIVAFSAMLLTLSVVEIVYRCWDPHGMVYYTETARYFRLMQKDEDFAYIHQPGLQDTFQGVAVDINSEGLRCPEFHEKAKGTKRLLVLGDSVVFGWGVEPDRIFPAVLQEMLRRQGSHWEVVVAGVGSWNTRTEFEWLKKRGLGYEPDMLLLYIDGNDVIPRPGGRTQVSKELLFSGPLAPQEQGFPAALWQRATDYSAVLRYLQHLRRRNERKDEIETLCRADAPQWKDMEAALRGLAELCRERGIVLVAVSLSSMSDSLVQRCGECLAATGTPYTILKPEILDHRNSCIDAHPDAIGHRMMAEEIWSLIEPLFTSENQ